jgi:hypothetical protein
MMFAKLIIEEEVAGDNSIITDLQNQGFSVEPNDEGSNQYTVSKNGQSALLDLSTEDSMTDSLKTIHAAFNMGMEVDTDVYSGQNYPMMSQKGSDHKLAQRVAAIGESAKTKLPVQATSSARGKTYHHDVYLVQPDAAVAQMQKMIGKTPQPMVQIDKTPGSWYLSTFMQGSGPLSIDFGSGWVLVNADEIRDALASQQRSSGEQSFSESKKGLWYNIAQKKKRMGKNYRPAKPGEKGRPEAKAWKNAQK